MLLWKWNLNAVYYITVLLDGTVRKSAINYFSHVCKTILYNNHRTWNNTKVSEYWSTSKR